MIGWLDRPVPERCPRRNRKPTLDAARATPAGLVAASVLRDMLRADDARAAPLQPVVPLVCGLSPDDPIWHPTTFTKNHERLVNDQVMGCFLEKRMATSEVTPLLSDEHFRWMAPCCRPGPPMPRLSGLMDSSIDHRRPQAQVMVSGFPRKARSGPRALIMAISYVEQRLEQGLTPADAPTTPRPAPPPPHRAAPAGGHPARAAPPRPRETGAQSARGRGGVSYPPTCTPTGG